MSCPQEPIPSGWRLWKNAPVPVPLQQFAVDVLSKVRSYPRGSIAKVITYGDQTVAAFVSSHSWSYRNGKLVTGLCIPGVSLLIMTTPSSGLAFSDAQQKWELGATADDLSTPDPTAAVYSVDAPPEVTDWRLITTTAVITVGVVGLFLYGMRAAGRAAR